MSSYKFSNKKPSVKELLEGATFRKTFTPKQPAPPPPLPPTPSSAKVNPTNSSNSRGEVTNDKKIFNRLCDLFGKDVASMNQVIEFQSDPPAKAAADILGYLYPVTPVADVQMVVNHNKKLMMAIAEEDNEQAEMKDRLMKEIKQKISERRRRILQQRRDLFNDSTISTSSADIVEEEDEDKTKETDDRDLWKAVPALADPDADSSFEEEERGRWDPDAAFSEVERILESLESNAALNEELVGRFRLTDHVHRREEDCGGSGDDVIGISTGHGDEDKNSDDSGMSSSADSSTVSSSSSSSSRQEASVVVKPVRKSKQQVAASSSSIATINISSNDDHQISSNGPATDEELLRNHQSILNSSMHIYSVAHDSPVIIDSISVNLDDDDAQSSIRGGASSEHHRIRLELSSLAPTPTPSLSSITTFGGGPEGRRRSGTSNLTNSAGEMFGSLRSNLSAGAYSTGEALNRIAQHVTDNIVRPIADTMGEAGDGLVRAAEPLVQHLQLLSTRLQVRYRHAAQHKQWLPQLREAADWIEDIPKVNK
jgi:hypothetical protein